MVGKWIVRQLPDIVAGRIENAAYYDAGLRRAFRRSACRRAAPTRRTSIFSTSCSPSSATTLLKHCIDNGIEAKVHYPIPLHLQDALQHLGYKPGDFPVAERHCREVISFPVDQHLSRAEQDYVIETVRELLRGETLMTEFKVPFIDLQQRYRRGEGGAAGLRRAHSVARAIW